MESKYKLLIVDDENIVRNGLLSYGWQSLGFETIGGAANGRKAIEMIETQIPHVVMTDVKMPVMDGLELCSIIQKRFPKIRVIILSGYKEFDYAKKAINLGVIDYLLKPVDFKEMKKLFAEIKNSLDNETIENIQIEEFKKKEEALLPLASQSLLNQMVEDEGAKDTMQKLALLGIEFTKRYFSSVVAHVELLSKISYEQKKALQDSIGQKIQLFLSQLELGYCYADDNECFVWVCNFNMPKDYNSSHAYLLSMVKKVMQRLKNSNEELFDMKIKVGVGNIYRNVQSLKKSRCEAVRALNSRFFIEKEDMFYIWSENSGILDTNFQYPFQQEEELIQEIVSGNQSSSLKCFEEYWNKMKFYRDFRKIGEHCLQLLNLIDRKLYMQDITIENVALIKKPYSSFITSHQSLISLEKDVKDIISKVVAEIDSKKEDEKVDLSPVMQKAVEFIKVNYSQKIMLADVADYVHLNTSYLSSIFKKELGTNFVDFITSIRLEKAKGLLKKTDYKVNEIAKMVGYDNYKYFTDTFKKVLSVSPSEFRNRG